jgi:hypothetical protein
MLKSPRRSINPDRAIKKFKNTRKLCGLDFSHEVKFFKKKNNSDWKKYASIVGLFGICYTSYWSSRTCLWNNWKKVKTDTEYEISKLTFFAMRLDFECVGETDKSSEDSGYNDSVYTSN